jgi:hypothetical protein
LLPSIIPHELAGNCKETVLLHLLPQVQPVRMLLSQKLNQVATESHHLLTMELEPEPVPGLHPTMFRLQKLCWLAAEELGDTAPAVAVAVAHLCCTVHVQFQVL